MEFSVLKRVGYAFIATTLCYCLFLHYTSLSFSLFFAPSCLNSENREKQPVEAKEVKLWRKSLGFINKQRNKIQHLRNLRRSSSSHRHATLSTV